MSQKSVSTTALKRFISYSVHFLSTHKDTLSDMIIVLDVIEVKLTLSQYTVQSFMSPFIDFFGKTSYYCGFTNVTSIHCIFLGSSVTHLYLLYLYILWLLCVSLNGVSMRYRSIFIIYIIWNVHLIYDLPTFLSSLYNCCCIYLKS